MEKLTIIIPVYNEEKTVHLILNRIKEVQLINQVEKEIIVVNDCSNDHTEEAVQFFKQKNPALAISVYSHTVNQGKGAAIRTGIAKATGDFIIIQDADLEYDPEEYNILMAPVFKADADVVYGSRFMGGAPHRILFFWHSIGNKVLTTLCNMFTNLNLTDMETGFKLFRTSMIRAIELKENRFGFEVEVTIKMARIPNIKIYETGISYYGRSYQEGKKINWKDGVRAIVCIFKYGLFKR